jgi:hypothetical protein
MPVQQDKVDLVDANEQDKDCTDQSVNRSVIEWCMKNTVIYDPGSDPGYKNDYVKTAASFGWPFFKQQHQENKFYQLVDIIIKGVGAFRFNDHITGNIIDATDYQQDN